MGLATAGGSGLHRGFSLNLRSRGIVQRFRHLTILVLAGFTGMVLAQTVAPLPKRMSGRWATTMPGGTTFSDTLSVALEAPAGTGSVTGLLTMRGISCGAFYEPLVGTWDGNELRLESQVRPNVNAVSINRDCGTGRVTFNLTRKPGQSSFEGESHRDGAPVPSQVALAPPVTVDAVLADPMTWTFIFGFLYIVFHLISIVLGLELRQSIKAHEPAFSKIFAARIGRWPLVQSLQFRYWLPWVSSPAELGDYSSFVRNVFRATRIVSTIALVFFLASFTSFYLGGGNSRK
jgi:hypothetical protein